MSVLGLITDRTQENVDYLASLNRKGWAKMTPYERAIWTGDPLTAADFGYREPVNILPNRVHSSDNVSVSFRNSHFAVTGTGTATVIIGTADDFIGAEVTLAAVEMFGKGVTLELVWYNSEVDYADAGCSLTSSGVVSTRLDAKPETWDHLAMRIHSGGIAQYHQVMLELGNTRHSYVPYTPILPTEVTKGAYNYSDLNRVETAVASLAEQMGLTLRTKTDWSLWIAPLQSGMERYLDNVKTLVNKYGETHDISTFPPLPDSMNHLTWEGANNIEICLTKMLRGD
jgi:hypothetical protein